MFDRVTIQEVGKQPVPYAKTVTVHEHKAPTDESIRLYQELEQKAYDTILHRIQVNDNALNFGAIVRMPRMTTDEKIAYIFTLNGKEITGEITVKHHEAITMDQEATARKIVEDASRHIAVEILRNMTYMPGR
jgi:hypothetical protein